MTSLRSLALMIPAKYRKQLLDLNAIQRAAPSVQDLEQDSAKAMLVLHTVWTTYIDPDGDNDKECAYCLNSILTSFRDLQSELIALANEENLLESI